MLYSYPSRKALVQQDNVLVNSVLPGHFDTDRATELARMRAEREGRGVDELLQSRAAGIPLGRSGDPREMAAVVAFLASERASFLTASSFSGAPRRGEPFSMGGWLNDLAGRTKDLVDEVNSADLVVMVATAGENVAAAAIIGEACSVKHVMTTALILGGASSSDDTISKMLAQLRPHVMMLVISSADEYIKDMLTALRA